MSCGYPNGTLRDRIAADTALADKSKGDPPLGHVRIESLLEAFENLSFVRQQLTDAKQQLEETKWECRNLEAENAKLRACLAEARLAMMEPHGEWKDVREAKALNMIRAEEVDK